MAGRKGDTDVKNTHTRESSTMYRLSRSDDGLRWNENGAKCGSDVFSVFVLFERDTRRRSESGDLSVCVGCEINFVTAQDFNLKET